MKKKTEQDVGNMLDEIEELEQAQYNSKRLRQEYSDTFIDFAVTMFPDIAEEKEESYQNLLGMMKDLETK